jgi:hypothetical protein
MEVQYLHVIPKLIRFGTQRAPGTALAGWAKENLGRALDDNPSVSDIKAG